VKDPCISLSALLVLNPSHPRKSAVDALALSHLSLLFTVTPLE
jgi:hypothetical protein